MTASEAIFGSLLALVIVSQASAQQSAPDTDPIAIGTETQQRLVDLTHTFDRSTIYWPTEDGFQLTVEKSGITEQGYFYSANRFAAAEHGGTHLDAPVHFSETGKSVDQLSLERLVGQAAVIDVTAACERDTDYQVGVDDLRQWEQQQQRQLVDKIVLIRTGQGRFWNDRARYLGTDQTGPEAVAALHFPGLSGEAALWLTEHRSVKAVGIDTASIDFGQSRRFEAHVTLFKHNIPVFENLANLQSLPTQGAMVIALPMKIGAGTGAPLRIIAIVPTDAK